MEFAVFQQNLITESITIPSSALEGSTRMRVRIVEDDMYTGKFGGSIEACNANESSDDVMDWGETEDYTINITSVSGIKENLINNLEVYPNPVTDFFSLTLDEADLKYQITSLNGQILNSKKLISSNKIDTSNLSSGIYFVELFNKNDSLSKIKFINQ